MTVALAFFFLIFSIVAHELGHALAFRESGIKLERLGIGLPLRPTFLIRSNFLRRSFGARFRIALSPWLLGAYVKPYGTEDVSEYDITLREDVYISAAGPIANIVLLFLFSAVFVLLGKNVWAEQTLHYYFGLQFTAYGWVLVLGFLGAALFTWVLRKWIALYLSLPIGVYLAYKTIDILAGMSFDTAVASSGGLVLISEMASKTMSIQGAISFGMTINLLLAFTNLLPLSPFDGGRIATSLCRKITPKAGAIVQSVGTMLCITLILFCLYADGVRLLKYFS